MGGLLCVCERVCVVCVVFLSSITCRKVFNYEMHPSLLITVLLQHKDSSFFLNLNFVIRRV